MASSAFRSASSHSMACSPLAACLKELGTTNCCVPISVLTSMTFCEALHATALLTSKTLIVGSRSSMVPSCISMRARSMSPALAHS